MKRTQRNLFIIMAVLVTIYVPITRLPWPLLLGLLSGLLVLLLGLGTWSRDLLIGRFHLRKRRYRQAVERFQQFERKLLTSRWYRITLPVYLNIYTFDGVALARNLCGESLRSAGSADEAMRWFRLALHRDPHYAVPYVNLAIIAARRGDAAGARREMTRALQLGFSPAAAHRILQRALAEASAAQNKRDDPH